MHSRAHSGEPATAILDVAERLVQQRGFNGFSYADVAAELDVTKASLHYHFAGKAELGEALMRRYAERFRAALAEIDGRNESAAAKLDTYAALYSDVLEAERMCLCGILAAEYHTLPSRMQAVVLEFFEENERWLEAVLEQGRRDGTLQFAEPAKDAARLVVSALEGAMLVARSYADARRFRTTVGALLKSLAGAA